jgi:hypothetical protein
MQPGILQGTEHEGLRSAGLIIGTLLKTIGNVWVTLAGLGNPREA